MNKPLSKYSKTSDHHKVPYHAYEQGHEKVIIIAPGFYNSKEAVLMQDLAKSLNDQYDVMVVDFRGHGKAKGNFHWTSKEYLDLLAVIEECQKQYRKTGLIGFSLGAATSIITCSKTEHIDSLIVVSAPSEFEKIEFRFWELDFDLDVGYSLFQEGRIGKGVRPGPFWLPKLKPKDIVQQLKLPVYYIHGTSDWLIKPWHSEDLFKRTGSEIKKIDIMKDWPHAEYMMKTNRQIFVSKIKEWFLETL